LPIYDCRKTPYLVQGTTCVFFFDGSTWYQMQPKKIWKIFSPLKGGFSTGINTQINFFEFFSRNFRHSEKLYGWTIGRLGLRECQINMNAFLCVQNYYKSCTRSLFLKVDYQNFLIRVNVHALKYEIFEQRINFFERIVQNWTIQKFWTIRTYYIKYGFLHIKLLLLTR
jgi:hypothetical protein